MPRFNLTPLTETQKALAVRYVALAGKLARLMRRHIPFVITIDELTSAAHLGLVSAARSYDASKPNRFETYANRRIWGAMLDELRDRDILSRSARKRGDAVPVFEYLSEHLPDTRHRRTPADDVREREDVEGLSTGLSRRDRRLILRHYCDGVTLDKMAKEQGRHPSRLAQRHAAILRQLRETLPARCE